MLYLRRRTGWYRRGLPAPQVVWYSSRRAGSAAKKASSSLGLKAPHSPSRIIRRASSQEKASL